MGNPGDDVKALAEAFEQFTRSTQSLEEAYRLLQVHARELGEELARKNVELALTNDYLNYILESMSDGVIAINPEGEITTFNRSATQVLGYSSEEAVGKPFEALFARTFAAVASPSELRGKSGRPVPVSERDEPISNRENRRIGHVKVFQDLTELEALRAQVRQMDRLAAIGEMAATVAHEIRNPLGGIRGFAALLARDIDEDDPRARLVQRILAGTKVLDRVVTELLEYTRPIDLHLAATDCAQLVESAITYLEVSNEEVTVENRVDPALRVRADADMMRQVLLNILLNAVQSIDGPGRVTVTSEADARVVTLTVTDTGCGMPPDEVSMIFSPFYTTKEKGTGLGLAVAAKIVEGHGGRLDVFSELGRGTSLAVRLPRTE